MTPPLFYTPARILRKGYEQAVQFDAPAEMRENLLAAAVEAETREKLSSETKQIQK